MVFINNQQQQELHLWRQTQDAILGSLKLTQAQQEALSVLKGQTPHKNGLLSFEQLSSFLEPDQITDFRAQAQALNQQVHIPNLAETITEKASGADNNIFGTLATHAQRIAQQGKETFVNSSRPVQFARGAGIGLGAAFTLGGLSKMFFFKNKVTEDGTITREPNSKTMALLQVAAGVGVVAAAALLRIPSAGAAR